jgi:hypothetical protein
MPARARHLLSSLLVIQLLMCFALTTICEKIAFVVYEPETTKNDWHSWSSSFGRQCLLQSAKLQLHQPSTRLWHQTQKLVKLGRYPSHLHFFIKYLTLLEIQEDRFEAHKGTLRIVFLIPNAPDSVESKVRIVFLFPP